MSIERQAARYMADIADFLAKVESGDADYGNFHVLEVRIGFDGDETSYRIVPNEHGDYDLLDEADLNAVPR